MAITAYTGVPGSGKSYALVEQVILPAVSAGRRVLTNIEGVDPDAVAAYCADRVPAGGSVGSVVLFDGRRATQPGFFPTEAIPDTETVVKGGDLIVFDEWRLYWPKRGPLPSPDLEPFLRWARHLVDANGVACDVAIGTQLATDVHGDFRGLIERTFKFRKLKAVGLPKVFAWDAYEGHLQAKGTAYASGNGTYKPEVFALYRSYASGGGGVEMSTDKRTSILGRGLYVLGGLVLLLLAGGAFGVWSFFGVSQSAQAVPLQPGSAGVPTGALPGSVQGMPPPVASAAGVSSLRIVGFIRGPAGSRVIVSDASGAVRSFTPDAFQFDGERPVSGVVDGQTVRASDVVAVGAASQGPALPFGVKP